jgi:hypothetical protein
MTRADEVAWQHPARTGMEFRVHYTQLGGRYRPNCDTLHLLWGPLGALESRVNKNREAHLFRLPCDFRLFSGGSDEIRTRDLRRDRRAALLMMSTCYVISRLIPVVS